jgi:L-threonylcarbamoyladenylate synthase
VEDDGRVVDVTGDGLDAGIARAAAALAAGGVVVLPTDTLYGLAADAFDPGGCARVFDVKTRPRSLPLPVLVRSPKQLVGLVGEPDPRAQRLMAAYWPGALTMVMRSVPDLVWDLGDADGTVAVRMPADDVALALIAAVGPLAVTSANRSGEPAATTAAEALAQLGDRVDCYLDGGARRDSAASTIVDLTGPTVRVLREGALAGADVLAVADGTLDPLEAAERAVGSGGPQQ